MRLPVIEVLTPPAITPVSYAEAKQHCRLDSDDERDVILRLIDAAVAHAEGEMCRSLISRTLRATYESSQYEFDLPNIGPVLPLFHGPVRAIPGEEDVEAIGPVISVSDASGDIDPGDVALSKIGTIDVATLPRSVTWPVVIEYATGYGLAAEDVPADIRLALLMHVAHLYRYREATTERSQEYVSAGLEAIYARHRAGSVIL